MSEEKKRILPRVTARIIKATQNLEKAETPTQVTWEEEYNASDWIQHRYDMRGLREMVKNSTILPQCINAYKNNIAGFGIGVRYIDDAEETPEMKAEFDRMEELIELLNVEQDTKEVFEDIIEAREIFGIAYLEVVRNFGGEVDQVEFVKDTPTIYMTKPMEPYIEAEFFHHGKVLKRKKKFRKYRQELGTKTIYFKEFGDPRIMDLRDGHYLADGEALELKYQANEIMEFAIGTEPYGEVRWIGQVLGIDGCRRAEQLNNNYFINGRHTPLLIMIQNGTLTDDSFQKLNHYMNDIKGEAGQHAFIVLESESTDGRTDSEATEKPTIEIKDLASILQKDELFQEYQENGRRRVQSAFNLPDLYVAYTTDFNRATAQTAQEVTEKQVFQPERKSLAWAINNRLLNAYQFQHVEAYFLDPDISNPDDMYKVLTVGNNAGGLTPNMAKSIISEAIGVPVEDYPENQEEAAWGDLPLAVQKSTSGGTDYSQLAMNVDQKIEEAARNNDDEVVAVMKEVRNLLKSQAVRNA